jgi:hypothetical protein
MIAVDATNTNKLTNSQIQAREGGSLEKNSPWKTGGTMVPNTAQ